MKLVVVRTTQYYLAFIVIILIFSCSEKSKRKVLSIPIVLSEKPSYRITLSKLDSLIFRSSVHAPGPISDDESYRVEHANPILSTVNETQFGARLKEIGLVKGAELQLTKFQDPKGFILKNESGDVLNGRAFYFRPNSLSSRYFRLLISDNNDSAYSDIDEGISLEPVKMAVVDFRPGGYKEIAILKKHYAVNGYNYDLLIYELK